MELLGKVAVITGGGSGIGRACSLAIARQGADVVVADIDDRGLEETVKRLTHLGAGRYLPLHADVGKDSDVRALASDAIAAMGRVDLLLNNAGVVLEGSLEAISTDDWEWVLNVNLLGAVRGARAFLPHMLERGSGYIVNTAGVGGLLSDDPASIAYDTSTLAVVGFSRSLIRHVGARGIGVSVLCPGELGPNGRGASASGQGRRKRTSGRLKDATRLADRLVQGLRGEEFLILGHPGQRDAILEHWQDLEP